MIVVPGSRPFGCLVNLNVFLVQRSRGTIESLDDVVLGIVYAMLGVVEPRLLCFCFRNLDALLRARNSLLLPAQNKQHDIYGLARATHTGAAQHARMGYSLRVYAVPEVPASAPPPMIICCTDDTGSLVVANLALSSPSISPSSNPLCKNK